MGAFNHRLTPPSRSRAIVGAVSVSDHDDNEYEGGEDTMENMKATFSCNRVSTNQGEDYVRFQLEDEASGKNIFEVKLTFLEFGKMMTGLSNVACEYSVKNLDTMGKRRELKPLTLRFLETPGHSDIAIAAIDYEVDGWKLWSPKTGTKIEARRVKSKGVECCEVDASLVRFVE